MPMFPLGTTLLPGVGLPLQVFEPRYREMVRDILAADGNPEFGQVLITHGHEAGGGDTRADVGTLARMADIRALDGGRYSLVAVGIERIRVLEWLPDDPYPLARIERWPDQQTGERPDSQPEQRVAASIERVERVLELASRLAGTEPAERAASIVDPVDDLSLVSFRLAAIAPIGPADRYHVLSAPGPVERLDALDAALDDAEAVLKFRLS
jgi:Lon protease-like protein